MNLSVQERRIDHRTAVMDIPDLFHLDFTGLPIHFNLADLGGKTIGRRGSNRSPFEGTAKFGRRIGSPSGQRSLTDKEFPGGFGKSHLGHWIILHEYKAVLTIQFGGIHTHHLSGHMQEPAF